jgi:hypothetical protein
VRSAEGLLSTRNCNWLALPVAPATHQPVLGDTQGNVSRQLAGRWFWGVEMCTSAATRGQRALLRFFNYSGEEKRAVPRPWGAAPEGLAGMPELRPLFPVHRGRTGRRYGLAFRRELIADRRANDGMHDLRGIAQSQAQAGVAASNHRPLITSNPYKTLGSHDQRKM